MKFVILIHLVRMYYSNILVAVALLCSRETKGIETNVFLLSMDECTLFAASQDYGGLQFIALGTCMRGGSLGLDAGCDLCC